MTSWEEVLMEDGRICRCQGMLGLMGCEVHAPAARQEDIAAEIQARREKP